VFIGVARCGLKPVLERPTKVRCLDWDGRSPSISLSDMLEAESRWRAGELSDSEWERTMDWFAPWADMTGLEATATRWWKIAFDKINRERKLKPLCPRRVIDACFSSFCHSNSNWDKLDSMFSYVNDQERAHTMFNLRSAMEVMIKTCPDGVRDRRVWLIREGFYQASPETSKNVMACWILWICGLPLAEDLASYYLSIGILRMTRQGFANTSKAVTTAMQKTLMLPSGRGFRHLGVDELAQGAYIGEFTGRANWIFDWDDDIANRCTDGCQIPLYSLDDNGEWTEDKWWTDLESSLTRSMKKATPNKILTETPAEHYDRRQVWMAGGSSGGQSVMVDTDPETKSLRLSSLAEQEEELSTRLRALDLKLGKYGDPFKRARGKRLAGKSGRVVLSRRAAGMFDGAVRPWPAVGDPGNIGTVTIVLGYSAESCHYYLYDNVGGATRDVIGVAAELQRIWKQYLTLQDQISSVKSRYKEKIRISKRAYAESVDYEDLRKLTKRAVCEATGSQKLDRMKPRSIHGTTYQHYARSDYVVSHLEKGSIKLPYLCGLLGPDEQANMDNELMNAGGYTLAADHDDYDRVHSLRAQAMQYRIAGAIAPSVSPAVLSEWREECEWIATSMENQFLKIPEKNKTYKVYQGGFTGARDTSFRNDRLHEAYEDVARKNASIIMGYELKPLAQRIRGDDILSRLSHWSECAIELSSLMRSGFMLNASKQVISSRYGVFLRVIYEKGRMTGYAPRSIGSLVMQPLQAKERVDVRSRVSAMDAHVHMLVRRGMRHVVAQAIWDNMMTFWGKLLVDKRAGTYVRVPRSIISGDSSKGGWGLAAPGRATTALPCMIPSCPKFQVITDEIALATDSKMSSAYASKVANRFGEVIEEEAARLARTWRRANIESDATPTDQNKAWAQHAFEFCTWLNQVRSLIGTTAHIDTDYRRTRGRYVIAPPGSGKTTEIKRQSLGRKALDADDILSAGGISWTDYTCADVTRFAPERKKGAELFMKAMIDGYDVIGAHDDSVTLTVLDSVRLDIVRVATEDVITRRWLERRMGRRRAADLLLGGRSRIAEQKLRSAGEWSRGRLKEIPLARNLSDAVFNEMYSGQADLRERSTAGLLRVVGVRGGYLRCGEHNYVSAIPNPRLHELATNTQPANSELIASAAELRGRPYHIQLAYELSAAGQDNAASWVKTLGAKVTPLGKENCLIPSHVKGLLSAPIASAATIQYWACMTGEYVACINGLFIGAGNKSLVRVLDCVKRAFQRDRASLLCSY